MGPDTGFSWEKLTNSNPSSARENMGVQHSTTPRLPHNPLLLRVLNRVGREGVGGRGLWAQRCGLWYAGRVLLSGPGGFAEVTSGVYQVPGNICQNPLNHSLILRDGQKVLASLLFSDLMETILIKLETWMNISKRYSN